MLENRCNILTSGQAVCTRQRMAKPSKRSHSISLSFPVMVPNLILLDSIYCAQNDKSLQDNAGPPDSRPEVTPPSDLVLVCHNDAALTSA